ncbi:MAG: septum formation initiator family protein [Lachnospiraceae bacterium]|nr:septum formation initiator family protein [Lachnospiraceae bacterium]
MKKNKSKRKLNNGKQKLYVALIVMFIITALAVQMGHTYTKYADGKAKKADLTEKRDRLLKEQEELIRYEQYTKTDDYIEITAEEKLGMVKGNWIIFKEKR